MTLYLKYRPKTLDELDLNNVRDSLREIVLSGSIPHAFLFNGPKGTGKTSAARILAKIVNCEKLGKNGEPCNKCDSCISIMKGSDIDIIELDAASNRGIDDIRSLKEGIYLAPARLKKKVYIIDEAHMLTIEAANAFLKTLEEPPDHVIFVLATTNPEKLPATVVSRLTVINFSKARPSEISRQLKRVSEGEKIKIAKDAIDLIAKRADGSFRDAVKIFESLSFKTKDIKLNDVESVFASSSSSVSSFFEVLLTKNIKGVLEFVESEVSKGIFVKNFIDDVMSVLHGSLLAKNGLGDDELANFSEEELLRLVNLISEAVRISSPVTQLPFEIALIKFCLPADATHQALQAGGEGGEKKKLVGKEAKVSKPVKKVATGEFNQEVWVRLLQNVREKNVSIEALLRASKPIGFDGKNLTLGVYYKFHKDRLEDGKNNRILEDVCKSVFGVPHVEVVFELIDKPMAKTKPKAELNTKVDKDIIDAAKEVFG